jgi:hypothetical protein
MALKTDQVKKAFDFYEAHRDHVKKLVLTATTAYAPTLSQDKNDPRLWRAPHWKWFLNNIYIK